jgi:hypothetical protein
MQIESEKDFDKLRKHVSDYYKKFPMFRHDIVKLESIIEEHIKKYSIAMVYYRQTKQNHKLKEAQEEIDKINQTLDIIGKIELMALLSQG